MTARKRARPRLSSAPPEQALAAPTTPRPGNWRWFWAIAIPVSAVAATVVVIFDVPEVARTPIVLWFLGVCPGMALVRLVNLREPLLDVILAIALSLALASLVPSVLLYLGAWSPAVALAILNGVTLLAWAFDPTLVAYRRRTADATPEQAKPGELEVRRRVSSQEPDRTGPFARPLRIPGTEDEASAGVRSAVDLVIGDLADRRRDR